MNLTFAFLLANAPNPEDCPGGDCDYYSDGSDPIWFFIAGVAIVLAVIVGIGIFVWRRRRRSE